MQYYFGNIILEAQNKEINFFFQTHNYLLIEREELYSGQIINITFFYKDLTQELENFIDLEKTAKVEECSGLTLLLAPEEEVEDDVPLGKSKNADGHFARQTINLPARVDCRNNKCEFTNVSVVVYGQILYHRPEWIMAKHGISLDRAKCYQECTIGHEEIHQKYFDDIYNEEWCIFKNRIENISVDCECDWFSKCSDILTNSLEDFVRKVNERMKETESEAKQYTLECRKDCRQNYE